MDDPPIMVATNAGETFALTVAGTDPVAGTEWLVVTDGLRGFRVSPAGSSQFRVDLACVGPASCRRLDTDRRAIRRAEQQDTGRLGRVFLPVGDQ